MEAHPRGGRSGPPRLRWVVVVVIVAVVMAVAAAGSPAMAVALATAAGIVQAVLAVLSYATPATS